LTIRSVDYIIGTSRCAASMFPTKIIKGGITNENHF
ncbi:MAG: hypothetical protein AWL62_122, partial [Halanaerobium sp. T82-1]